MPQLRIVSKGTHRVLEADRQTIHTGCTSWKGIFDATSFLSTLVKPTKIIGVTLWRTIDLRLAL